MFHVQKRYAGDGTGPNPHPLTNKPTDLPPIAPSDVGRTGYGEIRGELRNFMGGPIDELSDFPKDCSKLERGRWYPYSLKDEYPPFVSSSADQNHRVWTEMQMEQLLDHHQPHEVHASELPDYHYFPPIVNELDNKLTKMAAEAGGTASRQYTEDQTYVPRFFRTGVPKLPRWEQDWYLPRQADGRFDWKRNIRDNGYTASLFDAKGWDRRYLLRLNVPNPPLHITGWRSWGQMATYFRVHEQPLPRRLGRSIYASQLDKAVMFFCIYWGSLLYLGGRQGHWRELVWTNDPYNYDICFTSENRRKGGFHGIV